MTAALLTSSELEYKRWCDAAGMSIQVKDTDLQPALSVAKLIDSADSRIDCTNHSMNEMD